MSKCIEKVVSTSDDGLSHNVKKGNIYTVFLLSHYSTTHLQQILKLQISPASVSFGGEFDYITNRPVFPKQKSLKTVHILLTRMSPENW